MHTAKPGKDGPLAGLASFANACHPMDQSKNEFTRIANAERLPISDAGPVLEAIVRSIEARSGMIIRESRVTMDGVNPHDGFSAVNCTIIEAEVLAAAATSGNHDDGGGAPGPLSMDDG
jgi:hypothetical protein